MVQIFFQKIIPFLLEITLQPESFLSLISSDTNLSFVLHQKLFKTPILSLKIHVIRQMVIICSMSMSIYNLTYKPDNNNCNNNKNLFFFLFFVAIQICCFFFLLSSFKWVTNKITIQCLRNQIKTEKFIILCFFFLVPL